MTAAFSALLVQLCSVVPDGVVAFFPSYSYMEKIITAWNELNVLTELTVGVPAVLALL